METRKPYDGIQSAEVPARVPIFGGSELKEVSIAGRQDRNASGKVWLGKVQDFPASEFSHATLQRCAVRTKLEGADFRLRQTAPYLIQMVILFLSSQCMLSIQYIHRN